MTVGAMVGWAVLSVVTFIVATKTLGVRSSGRFQEKAGENLSGSGDNPVSRGGLLRVHATKKGIFLRESRFRDQCGGRRG